jgi:dCMP deaminase
VRDGHELATVHAEQNAIADAARRGVSVAGATAYISHFPCINCAKVLAAAGIRAVRYHLDYDNDPLVFELLSEAGVEISRF